MCYIYFPHNISIFLDNHCIYIRTKYTYYFLCYFYYFMLTIATLYSLKGNLRCLHFNYYILSRIKHFPLIHGNILVQILYNVYLILMFIYSTFESLLLQIININMLIGKFTDHLLQIININMLIGKFTDH